MTKKELLARIEELERKVAKLELEKQVITISTPIFPQPPIKWGFDETRTAPAIPPYWYTTTGG